MRDRDIREAIKTALDATGFFDEVIHNAAEGDAAVSTIEQKTAVIYPLSGEISDQWDTLATGAMTIEAQCQIVFIITSEDDKHRDDALEQMFNVACNALNKQSLAGLTFPDFTRFRRWQWLPATPPERRLETIFGYIFEVPNAVSFDTAD
jgi:hypothetical protein